MRRLLLAVLSFSGLSLPGLCACGDSHSTSTNDGMSLGWHPCGSIECASVAVPIDHSAPELGTIRIAINRAASQSGESRGVVLLNPGGPGAPGKFLVEGLAPGLLQLLPGYDFIGFDPRGVGESAALRCSRDADLVGLLKTGGVAAVLDGLRSLSRVCAAESGPLFQHVGSNQVVADIDLIRQSLGVEEINFIGISYGSRLGELYAQAFPEHARGIVLDSPVAPVADVTEQVRGQFDALLQAHQTFFTDCASGALDCPPDPQGIFDSVLASEPNDNDRAQFIANWQALLSAPPGREILAQLLHQVASGQIMTAANMPVMARVDARAGINFIANLSTNCADSTVPPPSVSEAEALVASFRERAPQFVNQAIPGFVCGGWEVQPDPAPALAFTPRVPPLVIGGAADNLTPLQWARDTVADLPGASLLLSEHYGHGALLYGSQCVIDFLKQYLDDLTPVPEGARCAAPAQPAEAAP
jgi:pimeloyl-ACP methyl ester carboxylesterase